MFVPFMESVLSNYDGVNIEWSLRGIRSEQATFGQVRYQPGGYCGPRIQRDFQLVLLYSGSCCVRLDGQPQELRVGHVYLFKPRHREHFLFDPQTPTHHFWCSVTPGCLPPALRHALEATPDEGHLPSECFNRLISAAFLLRTVQSPASLQVVDTLAITLFSEFLNLADHDTLMIREDACVTRALRYMEEHLGESDCFVGAQRAAHCSENALIYKFRKALGTTPARHLWRLRTEKGLALLAETGLSVTEIADQCGFKNPFHFSRCVRRIQGQPPREIRRRAWS